MQTYCNLHDICRRTMHFADWSIGLPLPYNSPDKHTGGMTYGGHSDSIVVDEAFVLRIPTNIDLSAAAPLLCAGITTYSPLLHYKVGKGQRVGIVGLSGLGHMGVKLAKAFGAHVVVVTTSPNKAQDPLAPRCPRGCYFQEPGGDEETSQ